MGLQQQISDDLRTAMKARDRARTSALRMAVAALKNRAVADGLGPQGDLDDDVVVAVLTTETKKRREAATAFRDAGREEQAASEQAEADVYAVYLPAQLDDAELEAIVARVVGDEGAQGMQDMGRVMKAVMAEVGRQADGSRVSAIVRTTLAG